MMRLRGVLGAHELPSRYSGHSNLFEVTLNLGGECVPNDACCLWVFGRVAVVELCILEQNGVEFGAILL